jgi:fructose-bisphosphate aldolase class 1
MTGDHTMARCFEVTEQVLHKVFDEISTQQVGLEGT